MKRKIKPKITNPKSIKIVEKDGEYRMYKVWSKEKQAIDPFQILSNVQEVIDSYSLNCKKWNIQPDMKRIYELVNSNNQKEATDESNFPKSGIFG